MGPFLLNVFMCDMLLILKTVNFTSYADNNTPFEVANNAKDVIQSLEKVCKKISSLGVLTIK